MERGREDYSRCRVRLQDNSRGAVALTMALMGEWWNIEDETEECVQNIEGEEH